MTDRGVSVSVVIPAYNAAEFVARTLDSVRAQTFDDFEVVVVDDGSADDTATVVRDYLARHQMRGRVEHQQNRGIAAARNAGVQMAAGAWVALLDHDDLWYPEKLAAVMDEVRRQPETDLVCHDEHITQDGRIVRSTRRRMPRGKLYEALLFHGNILSPSATLFRRDAALALGGFDERAEYSTVEDYDFWMRFSRQGHFRFLDRVLGEYVLVDRAASRRIVFHHAALERMLRDHLEPYCAAHPGMRSRVRARRRLAQVYRSALRQLIAYGEAAPDQRAFVARMLQTYPLQPRNMAAALMWAAGTIGSRLRAQGSS